MVTAQTDRWQHFNPTLCNTVFSDRLMVTLETLKKCTTQYSQIGVIQKHWKHCATWTPPVGHSSDRWMEKLKKCVTLFSRTDGWKHFNPTLCDTLSQDWGIDTLLVAHTQFAAQLKQWISSKYQYPVLYNTHSTCSYTKLLKH